MVASISNNSSSVSNWADSVFSKLDTKNQGYIEKSDLQSALSATGDSNGTQSSDIDDAFSALDGDGDGKVTKSELTDAMTKLSDQLNAQFDASRMNGGGGMRPDGPPPGPPPGGTGGTTEAADPNGDGTAKTHQHDPMREFAHALNMLKAYADNGSDGTSSSTGSTSTTSVSVEA